MKTQNKKQVVNQKTATIVAASINHDTLANQIVAWYNQNFITADNVQAIGTRIAIRALKTVYQAGATDYIRTLYNGLIADINTNKNTLNATYSDGYDIAQTAICYLCEHIGKSLDYVVDIDKKDNPITVKKACFRTVNRYIMSERNRTTKTNYLEDNGNYIVIPKEWDTPTITDYKGITEKIQAMNLTDRQQKILAYRLRGKSIEQIAKVLQVSRQAVIKTLTQIQAKYLAICDDVQLQQPTTKTQATNNQNAYNNIDASKLTENELQLYTIYQGTQSITKTAQTLNKSRQAVQNALKRMTSK